MSLLDPELLQRLARSRLLTNGANANTGVGERRSRGKGPGMEFADHRDYQLGDDIRHLDHHVYARLGERVIRQFALYQQLQVTILIDASGSMAHGQPQKWRHAAALAGALSHVALAGGDRATVGAFSAGRIAWYQRCSRPQQIPGLLGWLERQRPRGATEFGRVARASLPRLAVQGLLIVISDWMAEGAAEALRLWRRAGQELVGIHLLSPQELDPRLLGAGPAARLVDAEDGATVEVSLDPRALELYGRELRAWKEQVKEMFYGQEGRYLETRSDADLEGTLLGEWRSRGLIR